MAKVQTFGDKSKKGKVADFTTVKVIKWYKDDTRNSLRILERLVNVKDLNELNSIDVNR
ncbi:MAG: hypothetical protein NTW25_10905 [Candidatus Kapabacteria bacterium]|jgi:hypothetical protein|nr:hypothetical protein [Candidatus Kapabacteria bacterium]